MIQLASVFFALVATMPAAAKDSANGEVCISGSPCREIACGQSIDPNTESRPYTFTRYGSNRFEFGVLDAGATRFSCGAPASIELRLDMPAIPRGAAVRLSITRHDKASSWNLQLRESRVQLSGPAGTYDIRFERDGYIPLLRTIELTRTMSTINARLDPLPALKGRVIDRATDAPVAGALITGDTKYGRALSNGAGQFSLALNPKDWPKTLTISAGGYAELVVPAPPARTSAALGDIGVSRGGAIAILLQQPKPGDVVALELYRAINGGRTLGPLVRRLPLEKGADSRTPKLENVEPGEYVVMAVGNEEWQKLGEPVIVAPAGESRLSLSIVPFQLRVQARSQGTSIPKARVALRNRDMLWQCAIETDDAGSAAVTLWQGGRFNVTVESSGTPYLERRVIERNEDTEWLIDLPAMEVTGVVVDGSTGQPVAKAGVALTVQSASGYQLSVHTEAGADGTFRFAPVAYGEHTLKAAARGYPVKEMTYTFDQPEVRHNVIVTLAPAPPIRLTVTDVRANPISGARGFEFTGLTRRGMAVTDVAGNVDILVPPSEMRDVFVVPRDGSLAFIRLAATAKDATLTVPDGVSRLVLRAVAEGGKPIPNVAVVMRYNGIVIPYEVVVALMTRQGVQIGSNAQGQIVFDHMPTGVYEFWPVGSPAELRELAAGVGPSAPVRIAAAPGENVAVMTFEPVANP